MSGEFYLNDGRLSQAEVELIQHFSRHIARRYQMESSSIEFRFKTIQIGMSKTTKLLAHSRNVYPYFIKIGEKKTINKEVSNFNRASARIPPLYIPPLETVIDGSIDKYYSENVAKSALVAYRYISGHNKGTPSTSLLEAFSSINKYTMIELIDELFGIVMKDLHAFGEDVDYCKFEHLFHNESRFSEIGSKRLSEMVRQYNEFIEYAPTPELPHGMVHGDLHCENVIVNKRLSPIIIDFEMMRQEGCLLNDFAEFEVALIVAALEADTDMYAPIARRIYSRINMFELFGTDKLSRSIQAIRINLADMLFRESCMEANAEQILGIQTVYNSLLLRYLCSYSFVAKKSLAEQRSLVVFAVLEDLFDRKFHLCLEQH